MLPNDNVSPTRGIKSLARRGNEVQSLHLGLHRISALMRAFGNPHEKLSVVHIAGTNGKGSVAAMAESILRHGGWRTGLYTSPHLVRLEERIRIVGAEIESGTFAALIDRINRVEAGLLRKQALDRPLTYFEVLTACAFVHFADEKVDVAVVEVGLGGRLDATNIVRPKVSVITGVSYDHQDLLGHTLAEISAEKAGIIKPEVPVVYHAQSAVVRRIITAAARASKSPEIQIDRDCILNLKGRQNGFYTIDLQTPQRRYNNLRLALAGEHQAQNAALAVTATECLKDFPVRVSAVRSGLAKTRWHGRMEFFRARRRTLLEGAHNPEGAELLRSFLLDQKEKEVHLVFGALRDKDIRKIGSRLFPLPNSIHITRVSNPRSADPAQIAAMHRRYRGKMRLHDNSREALESAWNECSREGLVVVTGSLYLLGEILPLLIR